MKKALITAPVLVVMMVVAYLAYDLVKGRTVPCETIFQQTSLKLGSSLKLVRSGGPEISIEQAKIQDLTERAQMSALNLKTCCIVLEGGKLNSEQFLRCKDDAERFGAQVEKVASSVDEARAAKQRGNSEDVQRKLRQIDQNLAAAAQRAEDLRTRVAGIQAVRGGNVPAPLPETTPAPSAEAPRPAAPGAEPRPAPSSEPQGGTALITAGDGATATVFANTFVHNYHSGLELQSGQSIPFEKMKAIEVVAASEDRATVRVTVADGRIVEGSIKGGSFHGKNDLGDFDIPVHRTKRVEFRR